MAALSSAARSETCCACQHLLHSLLGKDQVAKYEHIISISALSGKRHFPHIFLISTVNFPQVCQHYRPLWPHLTCHISSADYHLIPQAET